ncbi:MAG: TetR/AcrR family transcriptional regulator [Spirochaetales bacterium]|nr:TetR/AcrR family transcriptional regulator [Spirochaetales bacterium]
MSPRGQVRNEQMRAEALEKITSAALEVFAEYGYKGATMKQITKVSGLSYGLVYYYFPSKERIFRHLIDFAFESSIFALNTAMDVPGTAWEKIENLSTILVRNALSGESSLYFLIMLQAMTQGKSIPGLLDYVVKRSEAYYEKLVPVIIQAQKSGEAVKGDPVVLAAAYFSFVQGLATLVFQGKGMEKKIIPEILINVLRKGGQEK